MGSGEAATMKPDDDLHLAALSNDALDRRIRIACSGFMGLSASIVAAVNTGQGGLNDRR